MIFVGLAFFINVKAQGFSPFVFPLKNTSWWNSIQYYNDTVYFGIGNNILSEGFSNRIVKVSKDLKFGKQAQFLNVSIDGHLAVINNYLVGYSVAQDFKNSYNTQFTVFSKVGRITGPIILGDTSNHSNHLTELDSDLLFAGYYRPPTSDFGLSGFLARYGMEGNKIWEKYFRINRDGFKTTFFDYVFPTRNKQILVIGLSQRDSFGNGAVSEDQVITALFDTSGKMLEMNSELDSLGLQYDIVFKRYRLPYISYLAGTQINDSTYCALLYNNSTTIDFPCRWVFFNEFGKVISHRKAWIYRDTLIKDEIFNFYFSGLVKKRKDNGFFALGYYNQAKGMRIIELDGEMYLKKEFPIITLDDQQFSIYIQAFIEDFDNNFYVLYELESDSAMETIGSLVCKLDSNGKLLSNGPLFPVGLNTVGFSKDLMVYPNPTHHILNISNNKIQNINLKLFSLEGKLLLESSFNNNPQFDMSNYPTGLYLLRLTNDSGESLIMKIIKD